MINELNEIAIGFDLCSDFSQITFYNRKNSEPMTVTRTAGEEKYQIPTPKELFPLVEQRSERGTVLLSGFFRECLDLLAGAGTPDGIFFMVTMKKMRTVWAEAILSALGMLGIPAENIYLQDHRESFYYYMLNQRKDLWNYYVALFEYEKDRITAYTLAVDYRTKPAFVKVEEVSHVYVDAKARSGMDEKNWQEEKDRLFLEQIQNLFQGKVFNSAYLIGDGFDKEWARNSLQFLCTRRHVFMGQNLYTKGACYGAMSHCGMARMGDYLYAGPDMIEHNIGMEMLVRGNQEFYSMISAGINWYMARHECEFILDDTRELVFYSRHLDGTQMVHTVTLTDLPSRPNRATRIRLRMEFTAKNRCRVRMEDLGLGSLYPSSGKQWEAVIAL
ncbi:MAG: DUF5716 family protein [Candidatus Limivivens sp.]|nr:DUF5716 family protein [Candidatus Limivivens sp.]